MNKNNFNIYYILKLLFLLILCLFILTGCSNNNDDKLKGKTQDQINYLEKDLISMLNGFNNISYANYRIEIKQETQSSQTNALIEESKKQGATNGESIQETNQNNNSVENSSNESQMDTSGNNTGKNEQQQSNSNIRMVPNSILLNNNKENIDWNNMKYEIEKIYSSWNTLFIDLNSLENGNTKTLDFSNILNDATKSIKAENKINSMKNISKMYSALGEYKKSYINDNMQINLIETKSNIIETYVFVTETNWNEAIKSINKADASFGNVINNVASRQINQSNINKAYVLLKEAKKAIEIKEQDIFFINYKMLMQELDNI